ncbi:MAG: histidine ammonia-lyase [Bdellovibrionales bacterium]|nr:histidine ammonia-lyase [Bdellovibrionales bacterium]
MIELGKGRLTLEKVARVARQDEKVSLSDTARKKIQAAHKFLLKVASSDEVVYGVNTGFGPLSSVTVDKKDIRQLQVNLIRSHSVGTGQPLARDKVRAMVLLRAATLIQGNSGVSLRTVEALLDLLNSGVTPWIPEQGSVGASGDLAPLAHLALVLIGEGKAYVNGKLMSGAEALRARKLKKAELGPKEGLALINGTQMMAAHGVFAVLDSEQLLRVANFAGALTIEAVRGTAVPFDKKIHQVRAHPGQVAVARGMRELLTKPRLSEIATSHEACGKVQDPYSLRCIPQVHGASVDTVKFVREIIEREINSVTDNPIVFVEEKEILSGGNFHGQYLAVAMDYLTIAMAEIASISERRIDKLTNAEFSSLPPFLMKKAGLNSGFMIVQYAAASIVSENKTLAHPASVDSIPTSADKEDHVSMGAWGARKAVKVVENVRRVLAMELITAAQGIDLLRPLTTTPELEKIHARIRKDIPHFEEDAPFYDVIEKMVEITFEW